MYMTKITYFKKKNTKAEGHFQRFDIRPHFPLLNGNRKKYKSHKVCDPL